MPKPTIDLAAIEAWTMELVDADAADRLLELLAEHRRLVLDLAKFRVNGKPRSRRNRLSAKKAGTAFATCIAGMLDKGLASGFGIIERRAHTGARDRADVAGFRFMGQRVVVECKDHGGEYHVGSWLEEAETERLNDDAGVAIVAAKRRGHPYSAPLEQVFFMTGRDLLSLLTGTRPQ